MTISRISDNFKKQDLNRVLKTGLEPYKGLYDIRGNFAGVALQEGKDQWTFIPVGCEVWYDDESNLFVTKLPEPKSIGCIPEMREDVGVFIP